MHQVEVHSEGTLPEKNPEQGKTGYPMSIQLALAKSQIWGFSLTFQMENGVKRPAISCGKTQRMI